MPILSRRNMIAATAAGGFAATRAAAAGSGSDPGPQNPALAALDPTAFRPPETDHGDVPAFKYPFSVAHTRRQDGGWTRQVTVKEFPIAREIAGVDMRLTVGGIRELHWHMQAEWSYMLAGHARITAVDQHGRHFAADVAEGDLWFFPGGIPHSIQGLGPDGCEFLLAFDDGAFSEYDTFLLSEWMRHTPREVLAKNFSAPVADFADLPGQELYIFQADPPPPLSDDLSQSTNPPVAEPFTFALSAEPPIRAAGGSVRIADSRNFKAATAIAAALVEVEPGGMREMHWHPNADEWQYYISGTAHMTVFAAGSRASTANFAAGDAGYVPRAMGHYIENAGGDTLRFLEIFRSDSYQDVSLAQWLGNTPKELVQAHLHLAGGLIDHLPAQKQFVVRG